MSRIAILASLALATSRGTATHVNRPLPHREPQFAAETFPGTVASPANSYAVLWRPALGDESPFGLIPTECAAQTQLLPTTWDAQILLTAQPRGR